MLKQKAKGLRIDVIGIDDKEASLKPLACLAAATGGTFVAATSQSEFKQGLATVLDAASGADGAQQAAAGEAAEEEVESGGGDDAAPQ